MTEEMQTFIRLKQVISLTGLSRSWIYNSIKHGEFPQSIQIGSRAVAWTKESIKQWQDSRIEKCRTPNNLDKQ